MNQTRLVGMLRAVVLAAFILGLSIVAPVVYGQAARKEALVKINLVWLKVSVVVPQELVATKEYSIPVTVRITEVEGGLKVFYLKGIRILLDNSLLEYVPDTPVLLKIGEAQTLEVKITPRFFAQQMAPGDVKDSNMRIDISYYSEVIKDGQLQVDSGYYSVFASIPVRVVAPRTYVYVQPSLTEVYEPYLVIFSVSLWVEGEGFIENARVEVSGVPVQCYLLTTGRVNAGEAKTVSTLANITGLGPFAKTRYNAEVKVTAVTPWGYVYTYSYPVTIEVRPLRKAQISAPALAVADAPTPVSITLTPPQEGGESITVAAYWNRQLVYSGVFSPTIYVALPEGEGELTVRVESSKYTPAMASAKIKTISAKPRVSAWVTGSTLQFQAAPLYPGSTIEVKVVDSAGNVVASSVYPADALPRRITEVEGATTVEVSGSHPLNLGPGAYTVVVTYNSKAGSATAPPVSYQAAPAGPAGLGQLLVQPLLLAAIIAIPAVAAVIILLRRRRT
uniref:Uncharacterized protein n=1 Tax=Thermofilum pendens TaxID=2269 RepID=A0A7C4FC01_THEPE